MPFRFDALVKDLFPSANMAEIEYAQLSEAIKEVYTELKLVYMPTQVCLICHFRINFA